MDIDSDKVAAFYQLSLDHSFSLAAQNLGLTQSALSQKVARLEDELEVSLLIRGAKKLELTEAGVELIRYYKTKQDLDQDLLSYLKADQAGTVAGQINIAAYSSITRSVVLPCLQSVLKSFPEIKINIMSREFKDLQELLFSGQADFILSDKPINREKVVNKQVGQEELVHVIPAKGTYPDVYLDHDQQDQTTFDFLKSQRINTAIKRNYFDDVYGIIDAVKYNFGQAIVSKHLIEHERGVKLVNHKKQVFAPVILTYFERTYYPKAHQVVTKVLTEQAGQYL